MYYYIEPEVAARFSEKTILDTKYHPPKVIRLHVLFDGWMGDDIVEVFPCFLVTKPCMDSLSSADLSGVEFVSINSRASAQFIELYPNRNLPDFFWLKVTGKAGQSDFGLSEDFRLVISEQAKRLLERHQLKYAELEDF